MKSDESILRQDRLSCLGLSQSEVSNQKERKREFNPKRPLESLVVTSLFE